MLGAAHSLPLEVVFSFDTTGSMSRWLDEVRSRIKELIERLQADIPAIRMAIFAHGDYSDAVSYYVIKHIDFTHNAPDLGDFVMGVCATNGGDEAECYELVMRQAREKLSWSNSSRRVMVMIGDAFPHELDDGNNPYKIDWREEVRQLANAGIRVYGVQCGTSTTSTDFFTRLTVDTMGKHIYLSDMGNLFHVLMAICYREHDRDQINMYENELRNVNPTTGLHKDLEDLFGSLGRSDDLIHDVTSSLRGTKRKVSPVSADVAKKTKIGTLSRPGMLHKKRQRVIKKKPKALPRRKIPVSLTRAPTDILRKSPRIKLSTEKKVLATTKERKNKSPTKVHRERVPDTRFAMKKLKFTRWRVLFSPKKVGKMWGERASNGYANINVFRRDFSVPAVYEISVYVAPRLKKYVVHACIKAGSATEKHVERYLFRKLSLRKEVDDVIANNCCVFVRRAVIDKKDIFEMNALLKNYSYAWKTRRMVMKRGVCISN